MEINGSQTDMGQVMKVSQQQLQNTSQPIIQRGHNNSISIYSGSGFSPKIAIKTLKKLKTAFPNLGNEFYDLVLERAKENGFNDKRFEDAINHVIDTHIYSTSPNIAAVISFDRRIKLYSYDNMLSMAYDFGKSVWNKYQCVRVISNVRYYADIKDIEDYHLQVIDGSKK